MPGPRAPPIALPTEPLLLQFDPCTVREPQAVFALDAASALAIRLCYMAAYQSSSVVAVLAWNGGPDRPVKLALPGVPGNATNGPDMVDPDFDPATGTLSTARLELSEAAMKALDTLVGRDPTKKVPSPRAGLNIRAVLPEQSR